MNNQDQEIAILKTNFCNMEEKIDDLKVTVKEGFGNLKSTIKEIEKKREADMKEMIKEGDKKYASKSFEKVVIWIGVIVGGAIISSLVYAILKLVIK